MYLKNLSVLGFKSFVDKTSLNFLPGITAIVGPNGCGKSNVADAIRWVLGEQSAKALRGGEMADVIFNGTDKRKPLGMAEVSMTLGNVDEEHLKAAGVELDYNEITLSRRVYRDGGSEYFINRTPCRLRDIQQLFMGTGVGRASYSIMAQGHITQLLSSRPEDRRTVFEEAAGITKFKAQKKEALRKLENTEQNLLRVADLIREVKRQIGSLQRQAGKARRYKQLMDELQYLDTQLARHQYDVLLDEIQQRQQAEEDLRSRVESMSETVLRSEDEIAQLREQLHQLESNIHQHQQQAHDLKSQVDRHESRVQFNRERLQELERRREAAGEDIRQAEERKQAAETDLLQAKEKLNAATQSLEAQRETFQIRTEQLQQLENQLRLNQEQLRTAQSQAFSNAQQLSQIRNEINALDLQKQGNSARLEKLSSEKVQLEEERTRLAQNLESFAEQVEAEKSHAQNQRLTVEETQQRLQVLQRELSQSTQELDTLLQERTDKKSRLTVLEQLQADHEGFSEGTLAALKGAPDILGSLVDKLRVPDEYITAIESALGHHLQLVLTENPETAHSILQDLQSNKKGRASIAALALERLLYHSNSNGNGHDGSNDQANGHGNGTGKSNGTGQACTSPPASPFQSAPQTRHGFASEWVTFDRASRDQLKSAESHEPPAGHFPMLTVIEAEATVKNLLERLLGNTWIVPDLPAATRAWNHNPGRFDFVTQEGEVLSRFGIYSGGTSTHSQAAPASILGRKNQIENLKSDLDTLSGHIDEAARHKGRLQSEQTSLQANLQQAQSELRSQEVQIATSQGEYNALQNSLRLLNQKIDTVVYEIQSLSNQEREGTAKREDLDQQLTTLENKEKEHQERVDSLAQSIENLRAQRDQSNTGLSETKVEMATQEQLCNSHRQQAAHLEHRLSELSQIIEARQEEIRTLEQRHSQAETEITESQQSIESLQHQREQVNAQITELFSRKQSQDSDIHQREETLKQQRRSLNEMQQRRNTLEIELTQKNMSLQNLKDRIQQKYQVDLEEIRSECITITFTDQGPAKVETLSPEEMESHGLATDWKAVAEQVAALQKRVDEIGPVNLVAIEEYEETEQRYQFLNAQHEDLVKAKEHLLEVIHRINTQTKEMFKDTFEKIRLNFSFLFTEIFGGGKADLLLTNEGDVLESGIDIMARPPGKQLRSISLLSGGEQTMTAVALLFAIYEVRPSPFCVLDELDAPLDESNINRFVRILQRFLEHSQFIIITHNKRTIGMADVLYGVTMEEHGVSRMVSVKFHKSADEAVDQHGQPLVPPAENLEPIEEEEEAPHSKEETLEFASSHSSTES